MFHLVQVNLIRTANSTIIYYFCQSMVVKGNLTKKCSFVVCFSYIYSLLFSAVCSCLCSFVIVVYSCCSFRNEIWRLPRHWELLLQRLMCVLLKQLHWLPIEWRIKLKIACITYKTVSTSLPSYMYLYSLLKHYIPSRTLHSSNSKLFFVSHVYTCFGSRSLL